MAVEILVTALTVFLLGGMFLGLLLSYRENGEKGSKAAAAVDWVKASNFYFWRTRDAAVADELVLRQLEHHLRQEELLAEQFVKAPSPPDAESGRALAVEWRPMRDTLGAMLGSSLFRGLTAEQCESFVPLARAQSISKGDYLFRLGQPAGTLFIIRSGVVQLTMPLSVKGGDREVVVQEAHARETIAWSALIEPYRFTMSARAGTDVELIGFSPRELQVALEARPEVGLRILANLAQVIARRLQVMHTMRTRELQRAVNVTFG